MAPVRRAEFQSADNKLELRAPFPLVLDATQRFPLVPPPRRHGVGKAEREHLQSAGLVVMRQIATRVPAFRGELTFEFGLAWLPRGPSQAHLRATISYTRR